MNTRINGSTFTFEFLVNGLPVPLYTHVGRTFVEAVAGQQYALRVTNATYGRVEVVVAIDGRNILKPEPAVLSLCRGQLIAQRDNYVFDGWRIDDNTTRALVMTDPSSSVASQSGDISHIGTIGVAAFTEKFDVPVRSPFPRPLSPHIYNESFGGTASLKGGGVKGLAADGNLGTGMGHDQASHVHRANFERASNLPAQLTELHYRSHAWLVAHGVILDGQFPSAFVSPAPVPTGYGAYERVR